VEYTRSRRASRCKYKKYILPILITNNQSVYIFVHAISLLRSTERLFKDECNKQISHKKKLDEK
jgi:hypothetical protein